MMPSSARLFHNYDYMLLYILQRQGQSGNYDLHSNFPVIKVAFTVISQITLEGNTVVNSFTDDETLVERGGVSSSRPHNKGTKAQSQMQTP